MKWAASNKNRWAETISAPDFLPFYYVISDSGFLLERNDGEIRKFRKPETAKRVAASLSREGGEDE